VVTQPRDRAPAPLRCIDPGGDPPRRRVGWNRDAVAQRCRVAGADGETPRSHLSVPGCILRGCLDNHYVTHWPHGPTNLDNLLLLCRFHHRLVHEGGWSVRGDPAGEAEFIRSDDTVYATGRPPLGADLRARLLELV
jgi:hypothetical protein